MLIIGILPDKTVISRDLDVDIEQDNPQKIHDALQEASSWSDSFEQIICVEDDEIVATYLDNDDYGDGQSLDETNEAEPDFDNIIEKD